MYKRIHLSLEENVLKALDKEAELMGMSRSAFVVMMLRNHQIATLGLKLAENKELMKEFEERGEELARAISEEYGTPIF